jgi:hypothetical protein
MLGGGKFATAATNLMGSNAETLFQRVCVARGMTLRPATRFENIVRHFDFVVTPWTAFPLPSRSARVEVKSIKCPRRGARPDPTLIYVELRGVLGHKGWVFGDADLVAFEQPNDSFLIVKRDELAQRAKEMHATAPMGVSSGIKGTLWSRPDRDDLVLCMDRDRDVKTLAHVHTMKLVEPQQIKNES